MPTPKKINAPCQVTVDRAFLLVLADKIHNPRSNKFLRLCNGTLQNGPDPTNPKRSMHCGLGELYFAMTGRQPEETHVKEADVVRMAVDNSTVGDNDADAFDAASDAISAMDVPDAVREALFDALNDANDNGKFGEENRQRFEEILEEIPDENDDGCDDEVCTAETFQSRSERVAGKLREAADCLPFAS